MEYSEYPDAEAIVIKWFRTNGLAKTYGRLPDNPNWDGGLITLFRSGGNIIERHRVDGPTLTIFSWAPNTTDGVDGKPKARRQAAKAEKVLKQLSGNRVDVTYDGEEVGGYVSFADPSTGIQWNPDQDSGRPRYMFVANLVTHI